MDSGKIIITVSKKEEKVWPVQLLESERRQYVPIPRPGASCALLSFRGRWLLNVCLDPRFGARFGVRSCGKGEARGLPPSACWQTSLPGGLLVPKARQ